MTNHFSYNILMAATLGVCCFFLWSCENDVEVVRSLTKKTIAVEEGKQIRTIYSQSGKLKAILTSPIMNRYQTDTPYIEFPKSLHVDFFNDSTRKLESQLNARYGRYRETENKVFLKDSVIVFNTKGDTLKCQELWWEQSKQQFYTDKPVQIHQKDKIIYGSKGLEAGQDFSWWTIYGSSGSVLVPADSIK